MISHTGVKMICAIQDLKRIIPDAVESAGDVKLPGAGQVVIIDVIAIIIVVIVVTVVFIFTVFIIIPSFSSVSASSSSLPSGGRHADCEQRPTFP